MTTYSDVVFNLVTTKTSTGITLPMKYCEDYDINLWSFFVDDMKGHVKYLREEFEVREDDVFICTYPRSGTHWTTEIVNMLLQGTNKFAPLSIFTECMLKEQFESMKSPRILCTHLPLRYLPPDILKKAKIIWCLRNPKDVAVSLHNLNKQLSFVDYNASFGEYLQNFLSGEIPTGKWFDHAREWERDVGANKSAPILPVMYEDMKANLPEYVEKIANFLGVQRNPEFFDEVAAKCDFKVHYKERTTNVEEFIAKYSRDTPNFLYRKGQVGDWKNWFTVAQNEQFDKVYKEHMKGSKLKIKFTLD